MQFIQWQPMPVFSVSNSVVCVYGWVPHDRRTMRAGVSQWDGPKVRVGEGVCQAALGVHPRRGWWRRVFVRRATVDWPVGLLVSFVSVA